MTYVFRQAPGGVLVQVCVPRGDHRNSEPISVPHPKLTDVAWTREMQDVWLELPENASDAPAMPPQGDVVTKVVLEGERRRVGSFEFEPYDRSCRGDPGGAASVDQQHGPVVFGRVGLEGG